MTNTKKHTIQKTYRGCASGLTAIEGMYPTVSCNHQMAKNKTVERSMIEAKRNLRKAEREQQKLFRLFVTSFVKELTNKEKHTLYESHLDQLGQQTRALRESKNNLGLYLREAGIH